MHKTDIKKARNGNSDNHGNSLPINMMQVVSLLAGIMQRSAGKALDKVESSALLDAASKRKEQKP